MPFVTIRYGPYLSHGIIDHKVQKITGLFSKIHEQIQPPPQAFLLSAAWGILDQLGYEIEIVRCNEYNRLAIEMYDREVFRCDIRNLMFNMSVVDDPVCQRAVKAVEEAKLRMCVDKNISVYGSFSKGRRELTDPDNVKLSVQETLPSNADLLFEITPQGYQPTSVATKEKSCTGDQINNKLEEKVGRVTIVEDKNNFLLHPPQC